MLCFRISTCPKDQINMRILNLGVKAQDKGGIPETMVCKMPHVYVVCWALKICVPNRRSGDHPTDPDKQQEDVETNINRPSIQGSKCTNNTWGLKAKQDLLSATWSPEVPSKS